MRRGETGAIEFMVANHDHDSDLIFSEHNRDLVQNNKLYSFHCDESFRKPKGSSSTPFFSTDNESSTDDVRALTELILWTGHRSPTASKVENLKES